MKFEMNESQNNSTAQSFDESPVDDCNVFVKYLPCDYTEKELYKLFEPYGSIINTKVMVNIKTGNSLGYGFVRFSDANFAQEAIKNMNRVQIGYKTLLCKLSKPSTTVNIVASEGTQAEVENPGEPTSTLYVRILSPTITDLMLKQTFSQYGEVIESQVLIDSISGKSKRAGLIRFSNLQNSIKAFNSMIGSLVLGETPLVIKYAPNSTKLNKNSPSLQSQQQLATVSQYIQPFSLNSATSNNSSSAISLSLSSSSLSSTASSTSSSPSSSGSLSPSTSSNALGSSSSFHICTYVQQPSQQAQPQAQPLPTQPQYTLHYPDQYHHQTYHHYSDYSAGGYYSPGQILTTTTTATGETIIVSSSAQPPQIQYYHHHHIDPYYYAAVYSPPIYSQSSSPNNSGPSSPILSPVSSPKQSYYEQYIQHPIHQQQQQHLQHRDTQQSNSILICTFKGNLEYSNLISIFSKYGELKSINININPNNNKTKCFITFNALDSAINAQQQLDKCKVGQSLIRVKFFNKKI
ncbi:hypothetical protein DLAC_02099 [Tieghemostelium lacteum]|uniref:RRM domain-containing protein n=1 Tax=Tieghemostelium lacteum TaxID=361077 RepID=A0A152A4K1_TIELA|nr:hypothetical protein DLAC_02099 [Tieghemostelium lacteum]|eukprot:KYR01017.1 hypothetical protein DLAC_02099 [Tieghemostelium lacteum]